jgi:hypothetical protein
MAPTIKRPTDIPRCSACDNEMDLTVIIPPLSGSYGLKVYSCQRCGRSQDYLVHPPSKAA